MSGKSVSRKSVRPPLVSSLVSRSLLRLNRSLLRLNRSLLASQECETETEAQAGLEEIVCVCV